MAEEKEVIEGEVVEEEKKEKGEKKPNAFSKLWQKTKQSVNDSVLESKIQSAFNKGHSQFTIYTKNELFSNGCYGYVEDNAVVVFGEEKVEPYSVIIDSSNEKAYYAVEVSETTVDVVVEGVTYTRPATKIALDENVEEVNVVKAGKRYFIYKGK